MSQYRALYMFIFVLIMRTITSYIFICLYVLALIRPVIPLISYNINYDYISEVLCINKENPKLECDGKCYLAQQIQKTRVLESEDASVSISIVDFDKFPIAYQDTNSYKTNSFNFSKKARIYSNNTEKVSTYITSIFQPPKFSV